MPLLLSRHKGQEFAAKLRFVSPALRSDQRALTVEAIAPNPDGRLKPGLFATALIRQPQGPPALLVPATAIETISGTSRVYVVKNGKAAEHIVTTGEKVGDLIEVTSGVAQGDVVVADPKGRVADGTAVAAKPGSQK